MPNHTDRSEDPLLEHMTEQMKMDLTTDKDLTEPIMARILALPTSSLKIRSRKRAHSVRWIAAFSVILMPIVLFSSALVSPTMAAALKGIPGVQSIFQMANDMGLQTADQQGISTLSAATHTQEGLTIAAPEVVFDGTRIAIGLKRQTNNPQFQGQNLITDIEDLDIYIDGQPLKNFGTKNQTHTIGVLMIPSSDWDSGIIQLSDLKSVGGPAFPDHFSLELTFHIAGVETPFRLQTDIHKNADHNLILKPAITKQSGDMNLTLQQIELTPVTTVITTRMELPSTKTITANLTSLGYDIFDDHGSKIRMVSGEGHSATNGNISITDSRYEPFTHRPAFITIKPYVHLYKKGSKSQFKLDKDGYPEVRYLSELEITVSIPTKD